jgi:hypothetical protein
VLGLLVNLVYTQGTRLSVRAGWARGIVVAQGFGGFTVCVRCLVW